MCFAPKRRALFQHLNFHQCSDTEAFCKLWLRNVLRATTACNLSSLIWPDGSAPATLASLLFDPLEPQIIGKTQVFRDFSTFSRTCIFFLLTLSRLWSSLFFSSLLWFFPPLLFHLSILSEVWLLNFLSIIYTYMCNVLYLLYIYDCKYTLSISTSAQGLGLKNARLELGSVK